jgi:hypothetical protein
LNHLVVAFRLIPNTVILNKQTAKSIEGNSFQKFAANENPALDGCAAKHAELTLDAMTVVGIGQFETDDRPGNCLIEKQGRADRGNVVDVCEMRRTVGVGDTADGFRPGREARSAAAFDNHAV